MFSKLSLFIELATETVSSCQAPVLQFFKTAMDQRPSGSLLEVTRIREQEVYTAVRSSSPHSGTATFKFVLSHLDSIN